MEMAGTIKLGTLVLEVLAQILAASAEVFKPSDSVDEPSGPRNESLGRDRYTIWPLRSPYWQPVSKNFGTL